MFDNKLYLLILYYFKKLFETKVNMAILEIEKMYVKPRRWNLNMIQNKNKENVEKTQEK